MSQANEEMYYPVLDEELPGRKNLALGMYVHVPFCSTTCDFCAFYQEKPSKKRMEDYFLGLQAEILRFPPHRSISTIFIGGGTPGLLKSAELERLCSLLRSLDLSQNVEWSVEIAPSEITPEKLSVLKQNGVNRISLGVQTFDSKYMEALGRKHPVQKTFDAYKEIRNIGFRSVNLDLIFGAPGQSIEDWEKDLKQAVALQPDHLSTYCLTFEEDTAMYLRLSNGKASIDSEREAAFYELAWEYLPAHGYNQYEVSNFARLGRACKHNLNTWAMNEWMGYGPSACSQVGGIRRKNLPDIEKWSAGMLGTKLPEFVEVEKLSASDLARDAILFGLRMNAGINLLEIGQRFALSPACFMEVVRFLDRLVEEGLAHGEAGNQYRLSSSGRILADAVAKEIPELDG